MSYDYWDVTNASFIVRMRKFLLTLDSIDIICLVLTSEGIKQYLKLDSDRMRSLDINSLEYKLNSKLTKINAFEQKYSFVMT